MWEYSAESKGQAQVAPPTIAAELIPVVRERRKRERGARERGRERFDRDKRSEGKRWKDRRDRRGRREPERESVVSLCVCECIPPRLRRRVSLVTLIFLGQWCKIGHA